MLVGLNAHCLSAEENADGHLHGGAGRSAGDRRGRVRGHRAPEQGRPDPRTFIGEGKAAEVKELVGAMRGRHGGGG